MKKMILLTTLMLIIILGTVGVSAAEDAFKAVYNEATGKVEITGSAEAGDLVTVQIFKVANHLSSDGTFSLNQAHADLLSASYIQSVLCYANQVTTDADGKFSFDVAMRQLLNDEDGTVLNTPLSDIYAISLKAGGKNTVKEFLFVEPTERANSFATLSGMASSDKYDVIEFIKMNNYSLGAYLDILGKIDANKAYDAVYNALVETNFDVSNSAIAAANLQKAIAIEAFNQGKIENIKAYEDALGITSGELKVWYAADFVDNKFKQKMTDKLRRNTYSGLAAFDDAARDTLVLQYVADGDGLNAVKNIIAAFDKDIWGVDLTLSDGAIRSVMGVNFDNMASLKSKLTSYVNNSQSNSGGGGGGGGISDGEKINSKTFPALNEETPTVINSHYIDMANTAWAAEAVNYLTDKGIVSGRGDGTFGPDFYVTRSEFVKMLVNAFGFTGVSKNMSFSDVTEDDWYYGYVGIAFNNGLVQGMSPEYFGAEENITRQDMSVMLFNAAKKMKGMQAATETADFKDGGNIADYAKEAVNTFYQAGILKGNGDGSFLPQALATRAQAAQIIYNLLLK